MKLYEWTEEEPDEAWKNFSKMWGLGQDESDPPAEVMKGEKDGVDYWKINLKLK